MKWCNPEQEKNLGLTVFAIAYLFVAIMGTILLVGANIDIATTLWVAFPVLFFGEFLFFRGLSRETKLSGATVETQTASAESKEEIGSGIELGEVSLEDQKEHAPTEFVDNDSVLAGSRSSIFHNGKPSKTSSAVVESDDMNSEEWPSFG